MSPDRGSSMPDASTFTQAPDADPVRTSSDAPEKENRPTNAEEVAQAVAAEKLAEQRKRRRLQWALAAAIGGLLLVVALTVWVIRVANARQNAQREFDRDRLEQLMRSDQEQSRLKAETVSALLEQCEKSLRAGDAVLAAHTLQEAKAKSRGGPSDRTARFDRLGADVEVLRDLKAIDQFRWTWVNNEFPSANVVAARSREALGRFAADPEVVPAAEAAARVKASVVKGRLVAALDRMLVAEKSDRVRAVLQLLDPDPYRDTVRDALRAGDAAKVVELAEQLQALEQPPGFAVILGETKAIPVERRRQLMEAVVRRRLGDLSLLMALGHSYPRNQRAGADERVRWYQAAVAVAPANAATHCYLGAALYDKGDLDGALAEFRQAQSLADLPVVPVVHEDGTILSPDAPDFPEWARDFPPQVELMRELFPRLPGILAGTAMPPAPAEACLFATLCCQPFERRFVAAVRLFEGAFVADPGLAADLVAAHRYYAAACAALAARGDGADAPADPGGRADLRRKALGWLRADLALWQKQAASSNAAERKTAVDNLSHWLRDPELSGLRAGVQRIGMAADERSAWDALWADVKATIAEARKPVPAPQP
jgi:tetratricopeptide (TPR) repeat protein